MIYLDILLGIIVVILFIKALDLIIRIAEVYKIKSKGRGTFVDAEIIHIDQSRVSPEIHSGKRKLPYTMYKMTYRFNYNGDVKELVDPVWKERPLLIGTKHNLKLDKDGNIYIDREDFQEYIALLTFVLLIIAVLIYLITRF